MEQLDKMYETLKALQELGLHVSQEQLNVVKEKEKQYLDNEVIPFVKEAFESYVGNMISHFELRITYDSANGVNIEHISDPVKTLDLFGDTNKRVSKKYYIRVVYPDGHIDDDRIVAHTFLNVVNYAGPEKVRDLGLKTFDNENIISDKLSDNERYAKAQYKTKVEGLYLMTFSNTRFKLKCMERISKLFNLGLRFERVLRDS